MNDDLPHTLEWKSDQQSEITLSTLEAEYSALSSFSNPSYQPLLPTLLLAEQSGQKHQPSSRHTPNYVL
jgi:hypothetical protein